MKARVFLVLALARVAGATELDYPLDEFRLTIPNEVRVCFVRPAERYDAKNCASVRAFKVPDAEVQAELLLKDFQITVAIHGGELILDGPMTRKYIDANLGQGLDEARKNGVKVHGFDETVLYDLVTFGGVPAMRNILELGDKRLISYGVQGRESLTSVVFYTDAAHFDSARRLVERIMATLHLRPPKGITPRNQRGH